VSIPEIGRNATFTRRSQNFYMAEVGLDFSPYHLNHPFENTGIALRSDFRRRSRGARKRH
jgi:hypothetical protein